MESLIVCVSISHGNTRRVADRMAEVLHAEVVEPEVVDPGTLREYDLVGFGSGIYLMAVHTRLRGFVRGLPHVGGLNKGRPGNRDLDRAAAFAARLRERVAGSRAAC